MKNFIALLSGLFLATNAYAQGAAPNLLFDDSDFIVRAETADVIDTKTDKQAETNAALSAKALLNQTPRKIVVEDMSGFKFSGKSSNKSNSKKQFLAPFGLMWNASIADTRDQGIQLNMVELKDYPNSFQAFKLPKMIDFFDRVYVSFGNTDELYRILAYSQLIEDDSSASQILDYYKTYSEYLDKKYGNMKQEYTPAIVTKTVKDEKGKEQTVEEEAPLGNPDFLSQLEEGAAVLYSTYHNDKVEATLSIGVDGDKKSYITIDYRNLQILKQQENTTIDAL